jgi:hypothetical protein
LGPPEEAEGVLTPSMEAHRWAQKRRVFSLSKNFARYQRVSVVSKALIRMLGNESQLNLIFRLSLASGDQAAKERRDH